MWGHCCKKPQKNIIQETSFGNRGRLKVLNGNELVINDYKLPFDNLESIWYHSEPSDVPYSLNQFLGWNFFDTSYSKMALIFKCITWMWLTQENKKKFVNFRQKKWRPKPSHISLISSLIGEVHSAPAFKVYQRQL